MTSAYKHCNHHHELTPDHEVVTIGGQTFVANKQAIPLLEALSDIGLRTRTHHVGNNGGFVSIIIDPHVSIDIRKVDEKDATRTDFDGETEVLIRWNNEVSE